MTKIITISREFGSGGRELGHYLAKLMNYAYYDKEIITEIASRQNLDEGFVKNVLNKRWDYPSYVCGRTFVSCATWNTDIKILVEEQRVIEELATKGNCIIVGRSAEAILKNFQPYSIFVYADSESKLKRCRRYELEGENLSDDMMIKKMMQIDKTRAHHHDMVASYKWGSREGYRLCINTSGWKIEELANIVKQLIEEWFIFNENK